MDHVTNCQECPLQSTCGQNISYREGDKWKAVSLKRLYPIIRDYPNEIMFIGDYPHLKDLGAQTPRIFSGSTIILIKKEFLSHGIEIKGNNFLTALQCHVNKKPQKKYHRPTKSMVIDDSISVISNKEITKALKCCRPDIVQAVALKTPKLIIPFGDLALRQIVGKSGIGKNRGKLLWSEEFNCWVFPMFHPLMVELDQANLPFFRADVAQVCQFIKDGYTPKKVEDTAAKYQDVESIRFLLDKNPKVVALDTETQGKDWCDPNSEVISYSISDEVGSGYNIWLNQEVDDPKEATHHIWWERKTKITTEEKNGKTKTKTITQPTKVHIKRVPNFDNKVKELRELCLREDIKIVMMNGNYDIHRLMQFGIKREEIKGYVLDIQTGMHTLDPDNFKNASLLDIQRVLLPSRQDHKTAFGAEVDKGDMLKAAKEDHQRHTNYSSADTDSTLECGFIIAKKLGEDKQLLRYYKELVHPVETEIMMDIERNGMLFDLKKLPEVREEVAALINRQEREIIELLPKKVKDKHREKGLRLSRTDLLRDALFSKEGFNLTPLELTPNGQESTGKNILAKMRDNLEQDTIEWIFLDKILTRAPYVKLFSTYLRGLEVCCKPDGRFHPQASKKKTATGRVAQNNPNLQQIPKRNKAIAKMIRNLIYAPDGHIFLAIDQSQSELRFIADDSEDSEFLRIYNAGEDIHLNTARMLVGIQGQNIDELSKEDKSIARQKSKAVAFGLSFGMQAKKFKTYCYDNYGLKLTLEESEHLRDAFFSLYKGLLPWHEAKILEARTNGFVRSKFGMIRHTPNIHSNDFGKRIEDEHTALNFNIQSSSNDFVLLAALTAKRRGLFDGTKARLICTVHDELILEVREECLEEVAIQIKDVMQNPPTQELFGWKLKCPMVSEISIGKTLGSMEEYHI